jgi:hypothetical protein
MIESRFTEEGGIEREELQVALVVVGEDLADLPIGIPLSPGGGGDQADKEGNGTQDGVQHAPPIDVAGGRTFCKKSMDFTVPQKIGSF